jgi:hypothetical protein
MWGRAITAVGSTVAQLMQPARAAPSAPFVCLPLCCSPNAYCSTRSGGLTRRDNGYPALGGLRPGAPQAIGHIHLWSRTVADKNSAVTPLEILI